MSLTSTLSDKRRHRSLRKYLRVFHYAVRDQFVYLPAFLSRNVFFVIVLFIFYSLWRAIYTGRDALAGLTITQVLWYFTFTEVIELGRSRVYPEIQQEVKDGTIAYALTRPYSYVGYCFSKAMGENLVKMVPLLAVGFITAFAFTGYLPEYHRALPFGLILITGGYAVGTLWQIMIGLLAFWFEEVSPFHWIIQKLIFVLGGMFFPIDFFPEWLQGFAKSTPFAFSAYWPAITMVDFSFERFLTALAGQTVYCVMLAALTALLFSAAVRKVHVQGG
jgi:ABC-2 type transport system permease protein